MAKKHKHQQQQQRQQQQFPSRSPRQGFAVIISKELNNSLRELIRHGRRNTVLKARAAITEAQTEGSIKSIVRTKHGESRLPNAEKYDLGDGYRLVVQVLDTTSQKRAFLFAGTHDETEHWLDQKSGYQYVQNKSGMVAQVRVTDTEEAPVLPSIDPDLESPVFVADEPILGALSDKDWGRLAGLAGVKASVAEIARAITRQEYETDQESVLDKLDKAGGYDIAWLFVDLMNHAHKKEFRELQMRLELACKTARELELPDVAESLGKPANSDEFITFEDADGFPKDSDWADWMLFLHPKQKELASKTFTGPARLRGVAGSGKTCVLLHRARILAKRYRQPVLIVTLTESMRLLLEELLNRLCGVERNLIEIRTMHRLAWEILRTTSALDRQTVTADSRQLIMNKCVQLVASESPNLADHVIDELSFLRSRLPSFEWDEYLSSDFRRTGQTTRIDVAGRAIVLKVARLWKKLLDDQKQCDHEGMIDLALTSLWEYRGRFKYRCLLVDEVQDLSQLELRLISLLPTPQGELLTDIVDGLFLVGDGAQTVYKKGFSLSSLEINVVGRSFVLPKNYRNTREVLSAAYKVVSGHQFADVDEDDIQSPVSPEYATARGERPKLVRCRSIEEETQFVTTTVSSLVANGTAASQICVIGLNPKRRTTLMEAISKAGERVAELREVPSVAGEHVKVSTIESAKGHEFVAVIICGLVEGEMPRRGIPDDQRFREAARLYVAMTRARELLYLSYVSDNWHSASSFLSNVVDECEELEFYRGELRSLD